MSSLLTGIASSVVMCFCRCVLEKRVFDNWRVHYHLSFFCLELCSAPAAAAAVDDSACALPCLGRELLKGFIVHSLVFLRKFSSNSRIFFFFL